MYPDFKSRLRAHREQGLWRRRLCRTGSRPGAGISLACQEGALLSFVSNDYLGLSRHPEVLEAMAQAGRQYGFGSGGSALLGGYTEAARTIETELAAWLGVEAAALVGSGFLANQAVAIALLGQNLRAAADDAARIWLVDRHAHASMLDAAKVSGWPISRFAHNDCGHLARLLEKSSTREIGVFTEGLFSMDGDSPDWRRLLATVGEQAVVVIDEAHSFGVLGDQGRGLASQQPAQDTVVRVLPLGKAVGGYGALIGGGADAVDAVIEFARSYIYSTALPPAVIAGNLAAIRLLPQLDERRWTLFGNIVYLRECLAACGIDVSGNSNSPIQLIACRGNLDAMAVAEFAGKKNMLIGAIRSPTVQKPRLRISLTADHSHGDIDKLVEALSSPDCPWRTGQ